MVEPTSGRVFNVIDIEREIEAEVRNSSSTRDRRPTDLVPSRVRAPSLAMPEYVEHHEGATEIGKLSAEAIVREYEAAAKDIEAMGAELVERVKQCEAMTRDALSVTKEMKETAARYPHEATRALVQIENCA